MAQTINTLQSYCEDIKFDNHVCFDDKTGSISIIADDNLVIGANFSFSYEIGISNKDEPCFSSLTITLTNVGEYGWVTELDSGEEVEAEISAEMLEEIKLWCSEWVEEHGAEQLTEILYEILSEV